MYQKLQEIFSLSAVKHAGEVVKVHVLEAVMENVMMDAKADAKAHVKVHPDLIRKFQT